MVTFRPIDRDSDLPSPGANAEDLAFDIKQQVDSKNRYELAKDIAAFANSTGGTILVGAIEDRAKGTIVMYKPLSSQEEAKQIRDAYSDAATKWCSPSPLVDPQMIEHSNGWVVVVNVWPFPGQAVGVQREKEPLSYVFPIRVGIQTDWLKAEQLSMLMLPELRRVLILLSGIKEKNVVYVHNIPSTLSHLPQDYLFLSVEMLENVLVLQHRSSNQIMVRIPLDMVRTVWRGSRTDEWNIGVQRQIVYIKDPCPAYVFRPHIQL